LLEMLDGSHSPAAGPRDVVATTMVDLSANEAWRLRDTVMGLGSRREPLVVEHGREASARLVRLWSHCTSEMSFEQMLPALTVLAQATNPYLHRDAAKKMWQWIDDSPCGRKLSALDKRWMGLFSAVAARDAAGMAANGMPLLEASKGAPSETTEFAFLASVAGFLCHGEPERARILLEQADRWVRRGVRVSDQRFLASTTNLRRPSTTLPPDCRAGA
jgi:hypothetical protein